MNANTVLREKKLGKDSVSSSPWQATGTQCLVRHQSGQYYARFRQNGRLVWKPLGTHSKEVAKARLLDALRDRRILSRSEQAVHRGKMTVGDCFGLHRERLGQRGRLNNRGKIKSSTRHYWGQILASIERDWPTLGATDVRRVTTSECKEWANRSLQSRSATRHNNAVAALGHVLQIAVDAGILSANPASNLVRAAVTQKQLILPTREQFEQFVTEIRRGRGWCSRDCADFVEFLAYSGCRLGEGRRVTWGDCAFARNVLVIRGDPETGTKNWDWRQVPMSRALHSLLERMRNERPDEPMGASLLLVKEAQKSMDRAANVVGMQRITHHDLRHLFATVSIEAGVDIPTVSRWLGHRDGGVLAMKTYGHLRQDHSVRAAGLVEWGTMAG